MMFDKLSFENFEQLAKTHSRVAVFKEIPGDTLTPTNAYLALADDMVDMTLLESNPKDGARYSYLCFDAIATIKAYGSSVSVNYDGDTNIIDADPFNVIREYQTKLTTQITHPLAGFVGGMVGFMSYDSIRLIESIPSSKRDGDNIPDLLFRYYQSNICFDHQAEKVVIVTVANIESDVKQSYQQAMERIDTITTLLISGYKPAVQHALMKQATANKTSITTDIDDEQYMSMVDKVKEHIHEGDIFQAVISRKFSINVSEHTFNIYRGLRLSNPSPYMFYVPTNDFVIAGASPEKLISVRERVVESCPLAGTRGRNDDTDDDALAKSLLADEKEIAEHMMLVDLARNDVGAVAVPGTVKVTKLKQIEKYSRVMHIASTVQGKIREGMDTIDALKASFPAGTLSGAPKIRAMEIIDEIENSRRGIYGGVICAINSVGDLDTCIAIRTVVIQKGIATVRCGAGIVADSDPQQEADETRHKARAILEGILLAEGKII